MMILNMDIKTLKYIIVEILPLFFALGVLLLIGNELLMTAVIIAIVLISFKIQYKKNEWKLFFIGLILGLSFELFGDAIYKLQTWQQTSLFGLPLWLPVLWGYGFVIIRRIGNIIVKN